eukprot:CAMPEP_0175542058 /NCGR_PEP_ID=MMETSP0096-20121207/27569_1 /TAXON_ID=311494 /ORGANISM="Alexandrium monilatum, Strain CCMP3105" /LENGTH=73 /DNA_ID=CAMNT_0016844975 /DNA_START=181 /DNA_END=399 /DNA_ORIENTATION=+
MAAWLRGHEAASSRGRAAARLRVCAPARSNPSSPPSSAQARSPRASAEEPCLARFNRPPPSQRRLRTQMFVLQ